MIIKFNQITDKTYNDYKEELKSLFPFVSIKRNKQAYAFGGFDIRPIKKNNYEFTIEQTDKIMQWLVDKDLFILNQSAKDYQKVICSDGETVLYQISSTQGFHFIKQYTIYSK